MIWVVSGSQNPREWLGWSVHKTNDSFELVCLVIQKHTVLMCFDYDMWLMWSYLQTIIDSRVDSYTRLYTCSVCHVLLIHQANKTLK